MSIIRVQTDRYALVPRETAEDRRLSLEALGLLCWLLAHGDGWEVKTSAIRREFGIGKDKAQRLLRELREADYLVHAPRHGKGGRWAWDSIIYSRPHSQPSRRPVDSSSSLPSTSTSFSTGAGFSGSGKTGSGLSGAGKGGSIRNKEETNNREKEKRAALSAGAAGAHDEIKAIVEEIRAVFPRATSNCQAAAREARRWLDEGFTVADVRAAVKTAKKLDRDPRSLKYFYPILQEIKDGSCWQAHSSSAQPAARAAVTPAGGRSRRVAEKFAELAARDEW